ncbi:MAG: MjaI family restriction endonuclease [Candidatus Cloacimonadaceae bacterium]|nr:MjaI family restriction endonuclease [Candidatus Cloacimonadaceae bacterium]
MALSYQIIHQGSVEDFGRNLYESQIRQWGKYKYSLEECKRWEYDLFITQSLKGNLIEDKAKKVISLQLPSLDVIDASAELDSEYRIDLVVKKNGTEVCGIQIKPHTFYFMRQNVVSFNYVANTSWGKPVYYLIYDEREEFTNLPEIVSKIQDIVG